MKRKEVNMSFPLLPLVWPLTGELLEKMHVEVSIGLGFLLAALGLYLIVIWSSQLKSDDEYCRSLARKRSIDGFVMLLLAGVSFIFGLYLWGLALIWLLAYIAWALVRSVRVAFFSR